MKSTLTALLGLILLIGAAVMAFPKLQDQPKISKKSVTSEVKNPHKSQNSKENHEEPKEVIKVQFGLNANFGQPPEQ
jgi:uncharacterized protein YxeA